MIPDSLASNRIIHVPRRYVAEEWGGTETVILETARQQLASGWRPEIVTSMALASKREDTYSDVPVRRYPYTYPFFGLSRDDRDAMDKKGGNLLSLSLFAHLYTSKNVRLFHAHTLKRLGGEVRTAARLSKRPYVVSLHGGVFDVPKAELESMTETISNKFEWGKPFGALFGSRRVLDDANYVICVGQGEMEMAKRELDHDRITYLPNGVDTKKFENGDGAAFRNEHQVPDDAFMILCLSRIDTQKNQALLVDAFARLAAQEPTARLVLAGPQTQPGYARKLEEKISAARISDRVHFLPGLRNDDPMLLSAFHACDVFVLPSRHEPFGIVVLEAWSAGKPVIVSHVGGLRSLVEEGVTGMFVDPESKTAAADLEAKMSELQTSPAMRRQLGEAGRRNAVENYDWSKVAARLEDIYQEAEAHAAAT